MCAFYLIFEYCLFTYPVIFFIHAIYELLHIFQKGSFLHAEIEEP